MGNQRYLQDLLSQKKGKDSESLPFAYTAQPEEGDEGGLNFGGLLAAIRRRIVIVILGTTAVASAAVALSLTDTPTYEAKFELLTEPVTAEDKVVSSSLNEDKGSDNSSGEKVDETTLKVLQSPRLMQPIAQKIQIKYPSSGTPNLSISLLPNTKILEVSYKDPNPEKVKFVLDTVADAYLKYSLEERQTDVSQGIKFVEYQLPQLQQRVEVLQARLQSFRQRYDLIDPKAQGEQLSQQVDRIVQQRIETETQLAKTQAVYSTLEKQLGLKLTEASAASALSESPRYQQLLNQLQDLETKIAAKSVQYREDSPIVQALRTQQQKLRPLIEQEKQRVLGEKLSSTNSISLASPNSVRLSQLQQSLDANKEIRALAAQKQSLMLTERSSRKQIKQFSALTRQSDDLERQLKIATDNLNQFLTKREALRIDAAQKQVPWQILTPPNEPESSAGSFKRNLILGTALGLMLSIGAALLLDKLSNVFYSSQEVKDAAKLPVIGEIPFKHEQNSSRAIAFVSSFIQRVGHSLHLFKHSKPFYYYNLNHFWESLRTLYTNIGFVNLDETLHSLAIVSATPGDGKSTIAVNLAQTAAAMSQRVLLVDADLRRPTIHAKLGLSNRKGLSNVIAEDIDWHLAIHRLPIHSTNVENHNSDAATESAKELPLEGNLFVMTAGQIPPNPTSLLSSSRMKNLAKQFEEAFDLVIYDTSPLLGCADSNLLAAYSDASILVVGVGTTNRPALAKALEQLKFSATPVLGIVANRTKDRSAMTYVRSSEEYAEV